MSIDKEKYVSKIVNASPLNLVIINFEIIFDYLEESKKYKDDDKNFDFYVFKARQFLSELRGNLNMKYEISYELLTLYNYVDKMLAYYLFSKDDKDLEQAISILQKLMSGFVDIEEEEKDKTPIMENTDKVYAGLTYGKNGKLNEFIDTKINKGFKA